MTNRIDTLIQRAAAVALAALVTMATLGSIDSLASREMAADSLLAHAAAASRQG
jgi:hypothetical protein